MKKMKKLLKNQKGLTLIELLAVIVILAIVAAIAVPAIGGVINNSRDKAILADASNILAGAKIASVEGACKTGNDSDGNTCSKDELKPYVEGLPDSTDLTYSATKGTNGWSVTYSNFKNIKADKYKADINTTNYSITEQNLNANLQK